MDLELLWAALACYAVAGVFAVRAFAEGRVPAGSFRVAALAAFALHVTSIGVRWARLGHGPFVTLHETLSSNLLSLLGLYALAWALFPVLRGVTALAVPVPLVMGAWILTVPHGPGHLPPTYATVLLYLHVAAGKVFLAGVLVASSLGLAVLARALGATLAFVPPDRVLERWAHRFLAIGFVFDTLMLVLGALWAQDAWGRYWDWDPLETWSFLTWASLGITLHLRAVTDRSALVLSAMAQLVFVVAFLTFFGIPFVSTAQHRGAI